MAYERTSSPLASRATRYWPSMETLATSADRSSTSKRRACAARRWGNSAPGMAVGEAGVFAEPLRQAGLTAEAAALDDQRIDALARGVDGRGQAGRPAADHNQVVERTVGFRLESELGGQVGVR